MLFNSSSLNSATLNGEIPDNFHVSLNIGNTANDHSIIEVVRCVDRAMIESLYKNPEDLKSINRRKFEELVAELFNGFGYEVELTQRTRDGGKDIIAVKRQEVDLRFLIECKRPDPGNSVSVSTVRELLGVKVDDGASKAILATTTHLSKDAKIFVEKHQWELEAKEFEAIKAWLAQYLQKQLY